MLNLPWDAHHLLVLQFFYLFKNIDNKPFYFPSYYFEGVV